MRIIDETLLQETLAKIPMEERTFRKAVETAEELPTVKAIPKDQYEARLKADLMAMLTEIQLEIDEIEIDLPFGFEPVTKTEAFYQGVSASEKVIQQKINSLKAESER